MQAPDGHIAPAAVLSAGQNQARGRAVRLLREAAAAAAAAVPSNTGNTSTSMSSGELAFAVEKAAMEAFGAGQPRYFEFVTRYAVRLKVHNRSIVCFPQSPGFVLSNSCRAAQACS